MKYEHLFKPLRVGSLILRNRIVAAPITKYVYEQAPAESLEIIAAKARGGVGLIILGSVPVNDREAVIIEGMCGSLYGPKKSVYTEQLSIIHQYGAAASVELQHCGMFAGVHSPDKYLIGPQTMDVGMGDFQGYAGIMKNPPPMRKTIVGMDRAKMDMVCDDYARSALEAKKMGFDMVMLHFAHGWLPAEFMSPFFNHRTDEFGGSFENRIRFPMMIIDRVRQAVGPDYPIDMRIAAREYVEGGLEPEEVIEFICRAEDKIDMVHISSGLDKLLGPTSYIESPSIHPHLVNLPFAELAKKRVKIPVVTVGGITMPDEANKIIAEGKADAIALGRGLIADPEWPNKARLDREMDICPCIRCVSCYTVATGGPTQGCAVNPRYERELRLRTEERPIQRSKKVVVVGGGPAGIRAALEAACRGHKVILLEKSDKLGGLLNISAGDPVKTDLNNYLNYLVYQADASGIEIRLNCEATPEYVRALNPDELVVAVGSEPIKPGIPGIDLPHVMDVCAAHSALKGPWSNVVIIGGGASGCELALSLAGRGVKSTIIEGTGELAATGNNLYRAALDIRLNEEKEFIECLLNTTCTEICSGHVTARTADGETIELPADLVVYCVGMKGKRALAESFYDIVYDVKMIGDCMGARRVNEATHEGYFAGHRI